ncbi:MAG: Wzz/FepE/Etk N-terminal domain-containing protein [Solirubrobacterales bacterium]
MNETTDAAAIFAPLWKRRWLILSVGILVAAATYAYYKRQPTVYSATTQLYLGSGSEEQGLLGSAQSKTTLNDRAVVDQATLINSSAVGEPVHRQLREAHDLAAARGKAHASASTGSDFITITAEAHTSKGAVDLANAYAQAYIGRERAGYQRNVRAAIASTRRQLRRIEAAQAGSSARGKGKAPATGGNATAIQAANLLSKINQLESNLSVPGVQEISSGQTKATLLSPAPKKDAIFGFVLGVLLAAIAAYVVSRFDRRLRSLPGIEAVFQTQILAALPNVREPIVRRDGRLAPAQALLEPLRRLHTTLQLGDMLEHDRERAPRTILFLSCDAGDGVSTAIAGLALVQRDANERVAVVDGDLRRSVQASLLEVGGSHGLAEVLAGTLATGEALQRVEPLPNQGGAGLGVPGAGVSTLVQSRATGSVSVLASGSAAANPPALLASRAMTDLLRSLAEDFDHVLIDAPSPLQVSDAMPLLGAVDGIVLVARVGHTREISAQRLMQLLARVSSAPVLGVLANSVPRAELEQYGLSAPPGEPRWPRKLTVR